MMLIFDEENIKDIVGELVYKQGLDMYYRNKVRRIEIIENSKDEFSVTSIVESAYNLKDYRVVILINKDNGKVEFSCNCNDFSRNRCCKHIAAVFIKINRDKINGEKIAPIFRNYGIELLNHYKEELINEEEPNEIINMEATLYIDNNAFIPYSIELKLGVNRLYIVKNLKELINSIFIEKNPIYFGKEFEFNPKVHCFSEKDYKLLSLLEEIYYNEKQVSKDYYSNKPIFFSGKKAYLTEAQMIKLLNLKDEKYINIKYKNKEFDSIKVCVQNLPLDFYLSFSGEIFKITLQQKLPQAIDKGNKIYIYEDKLYIPSESQTRDFKPIYEIMKKQNSNTIEFSKNHIQEVATYVIPKVRSICRNLTQDETLVTIFQEEPLKIEFYLDRYEDYIICDVLFNYGIKSFSLEEKSANAENVVLIRNIKEENKALKALEVIGFKRDKSKYYLKEEERVMNFIIEGIKTIMNLGEVYYSDNFKSIKIMSPKSFTASIGVNNSNLLEFDFEVEGADKSELKSLFNSLKHRKKYHKLKDGSILPLNSEHINNFNTLIENLDIDISKIDEGRITLPKYASLYIDESIEQNNLGFILRNKTFMDLINSIRDINNIDYKLPQNLSGNLRDYQKIGFKWFKTLSYCDFGGILGDEMGLGKTFQAITYILSEKEENNLTKPALVVCPTSLVYNWLNEFEKFAQHIDVLVICGSKNERLDQMEQIAKHDVIITSYPLIRRDIEEYRDMYFSICILDEAQQIKNPSSLNAQSVKEINAIKRFALTGTPIENSITELWSIFDFIMPGYLKSHSRFVKRFEVPIIKENNKAVLEELLKLIRPFILRRFKKDVALELPPKIEHKVVVDMTEEQKKLYASYANSFKEEIIGEIKERGFNRSKIKILSLLTRLRQICCDPSSFLENYDGDSGKYIALQEILEESIANGHRILLFSQFTTILNNIKERLVKLGISSLYLDGSVPSSKRLEMVDEFNEGETKIFLISLKAGGTGLNLTGADLVIHFDPWWNPAVEDQAVDRAHRIGQTKTVEVIKLITKGTIEEKIYDLQERKKQIIETVLDGERHENIILSKMTEEDVEELFK